MEFFAPRDKSQFILQLITVKTGKHIKFCFAFESNKHISNFFLLGRSYKCSSEQIRHQTVSLNAFSTNPQSKKMKLVSVFLVFMLVKGGNMVPVLNQLPSGHFRCTSGATDQEVLRCDGKEDCPDGSDETGCVRPSCPEGLVACGIVAKCISTQRRCDGQNDCGDGSDELGCRNTTHNSPVFFHCKNNVVVPMTWRCDGDKDCPDGSDESGCHNHVCTHNDVFRCPNGSCIPMTWRCDGDSDCLDGSDELDCTSK